MKYFINANVPVSTCNLRCKYCYITQAGAFTSKLPIFKYDYDLITKAFNPKRFGGLCHVNLCGNGETLLPKDVVEIIRRILEQGHYVFIITNGTLTNRFKEIVDNYPPELLRRLGFKFSFHYQELEKLGLFDVFFDNVKMVKDAGCSFSVELTPNDKLIPLKEDIKRMCIKEVGAYCHLSVGRDESERSKPILTKLDKHKYLETWGDFKSIMFDYKMTTFNKKRREFCYAGLWSCVLDIYSGYLGSCYGQGFTKNIYKNLEKQIKIIPVGKHCKEPHCYNSHAFLTLGLIPELKAPKYSEIRNRYALDGSEWLNEDMKQFLSCKLYEENSILKENERKIYECKYYLQFCISKLNEGVARLINKFKRRVLND